MSGFAVYASRDFFAVLAEAMQMASSSSVSCRISHNLVCGTYTFALYILLLLIYGSLSIYKFGVKRNQGDVKKRMIYFFSGLISLILSLIIDAVGNFFPELELIFDLMLFTLMTIGMLLMARVFLSKRQIQ